MEKRQTAVEWLVEQIKSEQNQKALSASEWMSVIEKARALEKEQKGYTEEDLKYAYNKGVEAQRTLTLLWENVLNTIPSKQ